ncbi:uncharacterized protein LOC123314927 isoform X2 [Coccinella septempunctata]|uniref:uncharacterized protein LOC123314927 isoform X2 n=1 Tax=Coccinella septempunctata TaxID=41139 RepID=UPI001D06F035|nr:uncharacterized protein LOC123314927 isoform X2 [Coccinella septempunctata]
MIKRLTLLFYLIFFFVNETNCENNNIKIVNGSELNIHNEKETQRNGTRSAYNNNTNIVAGRFKRANYENYTEKVVQMGDEARFPCYIEKENLTVLWIKIDKTTNEEHNITVNYTTVHMDKRFNQTKQQGSKNWELSIKYTQKSDEGLYLCKATTKPVTKIYVELILIEAIARILDTDEKETGMIKVKLFSPLRLSCVLYNSISPPCYIFWYHYDTMINYDLDDNASVRRGRQGSELIFPKTEARHQGNYSCVPSNARQASIVVDVHGEIKKAANGRMPMTSKEMISVTLPLIFILSILM